MNKTMLTRRVAAVKRADPGVKRTLAKVERQQRAIAQRIQPQTNRGGVKG